MSSKLRQNASITQRLHITPMLKKAINLLTYSHVELIKAIREELEENPFLEETYDCSPLDFDFSPEILTDEGEKDTKEENFSHLLENPTLSSLEEWDNYLGEFSHQSTLPENEKNDGKSNNFLIESYHEVKNGLEAHLLAQLLLVNFSDRQRKIAECIIGNLDEDGYLIASDLEIASLATVDINEIPPVLNIIRSFEPDGVASRTLSECLITQIIKKKFPNSDILVSLVSTYLHELEKKAYKLILKKLHIDSNLLKICLSRIQSLNPRPGAGFSGNTPPSIIPDLIVKKVENEFIVILNDEDIPCLRLSEQAESLLQKKELYSKEDQNYIDEHYTSAVTVIKNINERQRSLYNVMKSLVKMQKEFFLDGPLYLKPLILKDVALDIGKSESSVSRITTNKFVSTPFGIFELKYFFSNAIYSDSVYNVSTFSIKSYIKTLIEQESPQNPLSDEKLTNLINEKFRVNIARRTISKYREELGYSTYGKRRHT